MSNLKNKIKSMMDSNDPIIDNLGNDDLDYIANLMNDLNKTGREHTISKIKRNGDKLDIETVYKVTYIKR